MQRDQERRHLSRDEMFRAIGIIEGGGSQADAARALRTSRGTIHRLWRRYEEFGDPKERHQGKPRITTPIQDRFLRLRALRESSVNATTLVSALQNAHNVTVSSQTVRNRLHEANLRSRRPLRCPAITRGNREARNAWCAEHEFWTHQQWARVLFTDESRFGLCPDTRRTRVWRRSGNQQRLRNVQQVNKFQGGTIMVWGGIMLGRRSELVFIEASLTADRYRDNILQPVVLPIAEELHPEFCLMHDNARPHIAAINLQWLQTHNVQVLPWPAQSPDLNPIEHVWDMLKRRVLADIENIHTNVDLFRCLQRHWNAIPQEEIDHLIMSMSRRCRAVLNARGGNTSY